MYMIDNTLSTSPESTHAVLILEPLAQAQLDFNLEFNSHELHLLRRDTFAWVSSVFASSILRTFFRASLNAARYAPSPFSTLFDPIRERAVTEVLCS